MLHKQQEKSTRWQRLAYLGYAFVVALFYDGLFWEHTLGLNYFLFLLIGIGGFAVLSGIFGHLRSPKFAGLFIPSLLIGLSPVLYNNELVISAAPLLGVLVALAGGLLASLENSNNYPFAFARIPLIGSIDKPIIKLGQVFKDVFIWKKQEKNDHVRRVLIGIALSIPLVLLFGWLFYQADEIFAQWVRNLIHIEITLELVWRIIRTLAITAIGSGFLYVLIQDNSLGYKEKKVKAFDGVITSIILGIVNLLFATFVFIQLRYLFGSAEFVLENGITFADYARKGFFELVWIMVFAALLIMVIYRAFSYHKRSTLPMVFQILLMVQVGVIAASALKRMNLYQDVYGFTVLRLYVEWFIYFVLAVLSGTVVAIVTNWPFRKFFHTVYLGGLVALTAVLLVNVDGMIAKENVQRFFEGKTVDVYYLTNELSIDVAPEVVRLLEAGAAEALTVSDRANIANFKERFEDGEDWYEDDPAIVDEIEPETTADREKKAADVREWFEWNRGAVLAEQAFAGLSAEAEESLRQAIEKDEWFQNVQRAINPKQSYSGNSDCKGYETFSDMEDLNTSCVALWRNGERYTMTIGSPHIEWNEVAEDAELIVRIERITNGGRTLVKEEKLPLSAYSEDRRSRSRGYKYVYNHTNYQETYILTNGGLLIKSDWERRSHEKYELAVDGDTVVLSKSEIRGTEDIQ